MIIISYSSRMVLRWRRRRREWERQCRPRTVSEQRHNHATITQSTTAKNVPPLTAPTPMMAWSNWLSMAVCTLQQILGVLLHLHGYLRKTLYLWWDGSRCHLSSPYPAVYIMANPFLQAASLSHFSPTVFEPNVSTVDAKIHQTDLLFMDKPLVTRSSTNARHLRQGKNGWLSLHSMTIAVHNVTMPQPLTSDLWANAHVHICYFKLPRLFWAHSTSFWRPLSARDKYGLPIVASDRWICRGKKIR